MRRWLAGLFVLLPAVASAQVAHDAANIQAYTASTAFSLSLTIAGTNRHLLAGFVTADPSKTGASVVWNTSESATFLCRGTSSSSLLEVWALTAPSTGAHSVTVTLSGSATAILFAESTTSVNQSSPISAAFCDAYTVSGTSHSDTLANVTNGLVVDVFALESGGGTITENGSQTNRGGGPITNGADGQVMVLSTKAGASSVTTGESWVNDFYRFTHAQVGLNPLSGGSGGCLSTVLGVGKCG